MKKNHILSIILILSLTGIVKAQNTVSPYSIFGPGEIMPKGFGRALGMGGSGMAIASDIRLNNLNPASYSGIPKQNFIFEIGTDGKFSTFKSGGKKNSGFNSNLRYVAFGFRATNWWAISMGVSPYSSIGYNISSQSTIEGSSDMYSSLFKGSGGISQFYMANAFKIGKNLSVGVNTSYLFGPLIKTENVVQNSLNASYVLTQNDYFKTFYLEYGLQYGFNIKGLRYLLGVVYANQQSLVSDNTTTIETSSGYIMARETGKSTKSKVPEDIGGGIGVSKPGVFLVTADYQYQKWEKIKYPTMAGRFQNAYTASAGIELKPWPERVTNKFYQNLLYRAGFNYNSSYLKIKENHIQSYAATLGVGVPLRGNRSSLNIALELGKTGTSRNRLVEEKYLMLHLNFSLNELWFFKKVIY